MLKGIVFAKLVIGCVLAVQIFNERSCEDFDSFQSEEVLASVKVLRNDLSFLFFTNPDGTIGLTFRVIPPEFLNDEERTPHFRFIGLGEPTEEFNLESIMFEFPRGDARRVFLRFKSTENLNNEWTVISRVFGRPNEESLLDLAERTAVVAESLDLTVANALREVDHPYNRAAVFDIGWVVKVMKHMPPKFVYSIPEDPSKRFYIGLPLVVDAEVLAWFNMVRRDMLHGIA